MLIKISNALSLISHTCITIPNYCHTVSYQIKTKLIRQQYLSSLTLKAGQGNRRLMYGARQKDK